MNDDQTTEDARVSNATKTDEEGRISNATLDATELDVHQPDETPETEPKVFDETYVKDLRDEAARYRTKAKDRDALAQRLHAALVAADGRLQDPSDLNFDEAHLAADALSLTEAIDELLTKKPHLAARRVGGDIGQGSRNGSGEVNLLGMLRGTN